MTPQRRCTARPTKAALTRSRPAVLLFLLAWSCGAAGVNGSQDVPFLNPNLSEFPAASIADCSDLITPPAGRKGFVFAGTDGRLYYEDGTQARFWGINVAKDSVFQPRETIDEAVAAIARAGFNLVRLHHVDDENGLLPARLAGSSPRIDQERLKSLDYWIFALKQRGICVYLDLLDFRTFREAEGVTAAGELGRGAKPCAVFDPTLIRLQQEYARELLFDHVNPYTGLAYARDPAVVTVELCDENGLFHEERRLDRLPTFYRTQLLQRWGRWLLQRYQTRERLEEAWASDPGARLRAYEDPSRASVGMPGLSPDLAPDGLRRTDRDMFFAAVHRDYFRQMIGFLRENGLRCPVTAVTEPRAPGDLWSVAQELDCTAINYYFDHPYFRPATPWQLPGFFSGASPLSAPVATAFAPTLGAARVVGKPLVVREWGVCWPNPCRAEGMLDAACYAALHDVDAMMLFTFDTRPATRRIDYFDVVHDPARWGMASIGARLFLQRQIRTSEQTELLSFGPADVFTRSLTRFPSASHALSWISRVANRFASSSATRTEPDAVCVSDTRELVIDRSAGLLRVESQQLNGAAGNLRLAGKIACSGLSFLGNSEHAAFVWQSLDGQPWRTSRSWLVRYISDAANTGQQVRVHLKKKTQTILALDAVGGAPVVSDGRPDATPTVFWMGAQPLIRVFLRGGGCELVRSGDRYLLYCDTPGASIELGLSDTLGRAVPYSASGQPGKTFDPRLRFVWGADTALVIIDPATAAGGS